jgi:DNA helicase-2/ATP-dependent DNA helicase PcrA
MPGADRASLKPPVIDPEFVPDPMSSFKAGDRIEHNRFGAGEILEITGQVPDLKARVHFDQYGDKLLILKFAKMRHK